MTPLESLVEQAFAPDGPLARLLPGYHPNEQQQNYARATARRLDAPDGGTSTRFAAYDAETGTGKTLGYLIPLLLHAALSGERVAVTTFTLHLMRQIRQRDLVIALGVQQALLPEVRLSVAERRGIQTFVHHERVRRLVEQVPAKHPERAAFEAFGAWAANSISGDLREWLDEQPLPGGLSLADVCLAHSDLPAERAHYIAHADAARTADVLICTHTMLLLHGYRSFSLLDPRDDTGGAQRPLGAVVVDEADRLPDAAALLYRRGISLRLTKQMLLAIGEQQADLDLEPALADWENLSDWMADIYAKQTQGDGPQQVLLDEHAGPRGQAVLFATPLRDALIALHDALDPAQVETALIGELRDCIKDLGEFIDICARKADAILPYVAPVLRWSPKRHFPWLELAPVYPGRLLRRFWGHWDAETKRHDYTRPYLKALILTSATLATPGVDAARRFMGFYDEIGLFRKDLDVDEQVYQPAQFGQAQFVLADPAAPHPSLRDDEDQPLEELGEIEYRTNPAWLDYAGSMILAAQQQRGRVLVLTTSYRDAAELGERVPGAIAHQRGQPLAALVAGFQSDPNAVLITPAAWEGVDLPRLIDHLVLTRLPFTASDTSEANLRRRLLIAKGKTPSQVDRIVFAAMVNQARRRLRQGFGRGIRTYDDQVRAWIADPRFPLPEAITNLRDPRIGLPMQRAFGSFHAVIPARFRLGIKAPLQHCQVLSLSAGLIDPRAGKSRGGVRSR